jgi:hypothetical protein
VVYIFIGLGLALAVYYIFDRYGFAHFKTIVNKYDGVVIGFGNDYATFRYNFLWTDANNPAYAFTAVMVFLLMKYKFPLYQKGLLMICVLILVLTSMSTGGLIAYFTSLILILFFLSLQNEQYQKKR